MNNLNGIGTPPILGSYANEFARRAAFSSPSTGVSFGATIVEDVAILKREGEFSEDSATHSKNLANRFHLQLQRKSLWRRFFSHGVDNHGGVRKKKRFGPKKKKVAVGKEGTDLKESSEGNTLVAGVVGLYPPLIPLRVPYRGIAGVW
ncbi:hypothetical protein CJ030_MR5G025788 [Morella rubra]|uniref:Uncharacterized protein n=1 Tax=Morella rubra TaxID=262757 RepID=A0A6A1VM27_9ROSI|nr:hypothetical protein CJ030_MR5G025788 [Morella rubra]